MNLAETQRTQRGDGKRLTEEMNLAETQRTQRGDENDDDCDYTEIPLAISVSWREKRLTEGKESRRDAKNAKRGWEAPD